MREFDILCFGRANILHICVFHDFFIRKEGCDGVSRHTGGFKNGFALFKSSCVGRDIIYRGGESGTRKRKDTYDR